MHATTQYGQRKDTKAATVTHGHCVYSNTKLLTLSLDQPWLSYWSCELSWQNEWVLRKLTPSKQCPGTIASSLTVCNSNRTTLYKSSAFSSTKLCRRCKNHNGLLTCRAEPGLGSFVDGEVVLDRHRVIFEREMGWLVCLVVGTWRCRGIVYE